MKYQFVSTFVNAHVSNKTKEKKCYFYEATDKAFDIYILFYVNKKNSWTKE